MVRIKFDSMRLEIRWGRVYLIDTKANKEELIDISTLCHAEEKFMCEKLRNYFIESNFDFRFGRDYQVFRVEGGTFDFWIKGKEYIAEFCSVIYSDEDTVLR